MEATIFPIQYKRVMKTGETVTDISKVVKQLLICKKLLCDGAVSPDVYRKMYGRVQEVLRMIMKTDGLIGYMLMHEDTQIVTYLFELDYHFDGMPVEFLSSDRKKKIIYAQTIDDFSQFTYPTLKEMHALEGAK